LTRVVNRQQLSFVLLQMLQDFGWLHERERIEQSNVIFAPKRGRKMLFDVSDNLAYDLNQLI